jgi:co-chaperonin GroES (HSP10)
MKKNRVKFNPIGEKVLVQVHPFETKVNGIYRVDHLQENHKGSVVATNNSIPVYIDDVVIYNPNAGVPVSVEGSDYILLRVDEIYGIET